MKSTRRTRGASGGALLAILALAWFYLGRNRYSYSLGQISNDASISEAFCLGSISRCNSLRLPNATVCAMLSNALQSPAPSTAQICSEGSSIPHIIHQSWKKKELPNHFAMWSKSWRDQNPDWEYRFWTDDDNRNLVAKHYPWVLETYDAFPHPIMRADTVRYMYMHQFGGVYADLDTWAMRPIENLTESMRECKGQEAVVAMMSDDIDFQHNIPNAWMASSPGHPFWLFLVQVVRERYKLGVQLAEERNNKLKKTTSENTDKEDSNTDDKDDKDKDKEEEEVGAEVATGPVVLKDAYDTWQCMLDEEHARMRIMPSGYVFVSDWHDEEAREFFDFVCNDTNIMMPKVQRQCQRAYANAHVITFWSHSWEVPWWEKEEHARQAAKASAAKRRRGRRGKQQQQQQQQKEEG